MRRANVLTLLMLVPATACVSTISLPLGGVAPGRGQPLGAGRAQFSTGFGTFPEVAGSLPALSDSFGAEVNPIPALSGGVAHAGNLDILGFSYGVTDGLDVGLNFSRGLHGFLRVVGNDAWTLSLSPSVYHYSVGAGDTSVLEARRGAVTNLSMALLGSRYVPIFDDRGVEIYGGGTLSRYSAWISVNAAKVEARATVPTLLGGFRTIRVGRTTLPTAGRREVVVGLSSEGEWTWVRQRNGRRDLVSTLRFYFTLTGGGR